VRGATFCHDVGHAKATADLDELTARDDGLATGGERVERKHQRRRAVVDDDRVLGAGQLTKQRHGVYITRTSLAALEIVLEVAGDGGRLGDCMERGSGKRGTAEVRVQHDTGGVDDGSKRRPLEEREALSDGRRPPGEVVRRRRGILPRPVHDRTNRLGHE
jgi:hypothetical protein